MYKNKKKEAVEQGVLFSPLSEFTIISGSEEGVGEEVLRAYIDYKKSMEDFFLNFTGWCSKEWKQKMEEKFSKNNLLKEATTSERPESIKLNFEDADATLIIFSLDSTQGNLETATVEKEAKKNPKLQKSISLEIEKIDGLSVDDWIVDWIFRNQITSLNVVGSLLKNADYQQLESFFKPQVYELIAKLLKKIEIKVWYQKQQYQVSLEVPSK